MIPARLGGGGYPLLIKTWRTLESTGQNISVIIPQKAIEKLQQGDTLNKLQSSNDVLIDSIKLGYFEKSKELREIILEPCWIFSGNTSSGSQIRLFVYARQFANFTAKPTYGKAPLTVSFTDTSDASPIRWNWDFGDGTNSPEKNPVHVYQTPGKYNISIRAWNDLGSDTSTKYDYISVLAIGDT